MKKIIAYCLAVLVAVTPTMALAVDGSRDSNGSFTWGTGAGNVVSTGTLISSAWANQSFKDVKAMLTDSLSRSGQGGMLSVLKLYDGTGTALDMNWTGATTTGLYHNSGTIGWMISNVPVLTMSSLGTNAVAGNLTVAAGNMVVNTGDVQINVGGVNLNSASLQSITKTVGGNLYISHAVAGGNIIFATPVGATGTAATARLTITGTNTISVNSLRVTDVAAPTSGSDAANKTYVDAAPGGLPAVSWTTASVGGTNCAANAGDPPQYVVVRGIGFVRGSFDHTATGTPNYCHMILPSGSGSTSSFPLTGTGAGIGTFGSVTATTAGITFDGYVTAGVYGSYPAGP
jgi:hypothetical protein